MILAILSPDNLVLLILQCRIRKLFKDHNSLHIVIILILTFDQNSIWGLTILQFESRYLLLHGINNVNAIGMLRKWYFYFGIAIEKFTVLVINISIDGWWNFVGQCIMCVACIICVHNFRNLTFMDNFAFEIILLLIEFQQLNFLSRW